MRIQHNILAMNAYRNYNTNTSALAKNLEKLSSGYKINRAGDDAAGLAISEKMRAQITGLNAAQKNVKDGISLVKTAEGAMQEIQDMLNRMDYLATQSANGTYDNEVDRANLQKEVQALKDEIDRIADSANFNGIKLLDGSLDTKAVKGAVDAVAATTGNFELPEVGATLGTDTVEHNKLDGSTGTEFSVDLHNFEFGNKTVGDKVTITLGEGDDATEIVLEKLTADAADEAVVGADLATLIAGGTDTDYKVTVGGKEYAAGDEFSIGGQAFKMEDAGKGRLTFTQQTAPKDESEEVDGSMKVNVKGANMATKAVHEIDFTGYTGANGDTIKVGDEELTWDTDLETTLGQSTKYDVTVTNSKATLTAKEGGVDEAPTVSVEKQQTTVNAATGAAAVAGAPGTKGKFVTGAYTAGSAGTGATDTDDSLGTGGLSKPDSVLSNSTIQIAATTADGTAVTFSKNDIAIGTSVADLATALGNLTTTDAEGTTVKLGDLFTISADAGGGLAFEAKTAGADKETVTGITFTPGQVTTDNATADADYETPGTPPTLAAMVTTTTDTDGTDVTAAKGEFDLTAAFTGGKVNIAGQDFDVATAADLADLDGKTAGDWTISVNGTKIILTETNPTGTTTTPADGTVKYTNAKAYEATNKTPGVDESESNLKGSNGDWNVSTTAIKNVTAGGLNRLASTYFNLTEDMATEGSSVRIADKTYTFTADKDKIGKEGYVDISSGDLDVIAKNLTLAAKDNPVYTVGHDGSRITVTETVEHAKLDGTKAEHDAAYPADGWDLRTMDGEKGIKASLGFTIAGKEAVEGKVEGKALTLQIGDTSDEFNQLKVSVGDMHVEAMFGLQRDEETGELVKDKDGNTIQTKDSIATIDISTREGASAAVNVIKDAINYVSGIRGDLGAVQNRLEHTANNLSVMAENIQDAESTIRDTDIAEEMMAYTKNNILVQSAQAMLAQANAVPQGVLQLLG